MAKAQFLWWSPKILKYISLTNNEYIEIYAKLRGDPLEPAWDQNNQRLWNLTGLKLVHVVLHVILGHYFGMIS